MKSEILRNSQIMKLFSISKLSGLKTETLLQGTWLLAATTLTGVFNYLANIVVGRLLIPSEYSEYVALLSMSLILGSVTVVIQTVITSKVSQINHITSLQDVGSLIRYFLKRSLPWAALIWIILILFSGKIANVLNLNTVLTVIIMGSTIVPLTGLSITQGGMRGLERYYWFGFTSIGTAILRLIFGVILIVIGWGVFGAVASLPLSFLIIFMLSFSGLADIFRQSRGNLRSHNIDGILRYTIFTAVGIFAFTSLYNMDVIIVKSQFTPEEAGLYAAVATLGKIVLYLPSAVATLLLSKVAIQYAKGGPTFHLLWKSLLVVGGICGGITVLFYLAPSSIVGVFFGANYLDQFRLLGPYGLSMLFYSLCNIWLAYFLALEKKHFSYALLVIALSQAIYLSSAHFNLRQIVYSMSFFGLVANITGIYLVFHLQRSALTNSNKANSLLEGK